MNFNIKEFLIILIVFSTIVLILEFILKKIGLVISMSIEGYQYLIDVKSNKEALVDCLVINKGKEFTRMNVSGVGGDGRTWFFPHLIQREWMDTYGGDEYKVKRGIDLMEWIDRQEADEKRRNEE